MFISLIVTSITATAAIGCFARNRTRLGIINTLVAAIFATLYCVALNPDVLLNGLMALTVFGLLLATALHTLHAEITGTH